ncbi:MAG: substrate-binding domain-containing protein [Lachnospiraceae bacterium]
MKKRISAIIATVVSLAMLFSMTACGAAEEVASAPVSETDESAQAEEPEAPVASSSDEEYEIAIVVKVDGIAWFDDTKIGAEEFAKDHPNVNCYQIAPESADSALQVALIEDCIAKGVDAIGIIPVDPEALTSVIEKAREAGIVVVTHEGAALAGTADYDMEAFDNEAFGAFYGENLAEAMGGKGKYVGMVGALSMQTHMTWYQAAVDYITENYPDMELVSEEPYEDDIDSTVAYEKAQEIMKTYPDLGGVLCMTVEGGGSFAKYLEETNNSEVKVVTLAIPSSNGSYIADGWIAYGQCWRPADAAYVVANICYNILEGVEIKDGLDLEKEGYESITVKDGIIYGDAALRFTADNIGDYNF